MNNINNKNMKVPEGWKKGKVKNLFYDGRGRIISEQEIKEKEGIYPVYSSQTENMGELGRINTYDFEGEFITWTTDGANAGTVFYRKGKFNCTNVCGFLKPKSDEADVLFFSYYLSTIAKNYVSYIGNPKLMNYIFKEIPILIPPLPEQQKIAEILETVDRAIEKTDKIVEKYKRIKQGLMQDLLTRGIDENGKIRSEKTHKFKNSPLGRIPEEWEVVRLGEVIYRIENGIWGDEIDTSGDIYPVIRSTEINVEGKIDLGSVAYRKIPKKKIERYKLSSGDILIVSSSGSLNLIGRTAIIKNISQREILLFSNFMIRIRPSGIDSYFLFYFLKSDNYYLFLNSFQETTTGLRNFPKKEFLDLQIPLPPLPEQQRIAEILSQIDNTIEKEEAYKQKLERIKKGLMEDLLTGRVRVNELIKEKEV